MKFNRFFLLISFAVGLLFEIYSQQNPIELGNVKWERNYDRALEQASLKGKSVLILFQEIPGCQTCRRYGTDILSDDFIVEIIETHFIPLAIYNNKGGEDRRILEKYNEPSWNNPVLRIVDENGKNLQERLSGGYTKLNVIDYLYNHLSQSIKVPPYIELYREELYLKSKEINELTFSMYCFWTGEKELGDIAGVLNTTSGFMDGKEVVKVEYTPEIISEEQLIIKAQSKKCANQIYSSNINNQKLKSKYQIKESKTFQKDKDQNYYLKNSKYYSINMFDLQATRVNSLIGKHKNPDILLSPRQLKSIQ